MKNTGIEALRILALLGVVFIHANTLGLFGTAVSAGFVLDEMSRFAVPCFFLISGFLWRPERIADVFGASISILKKIGLFFVFWTVFYLVAEFSGLYPVAFGANQLAYLAIPFTGGPGYHLWFLPALIIGSAISWALLRIFGLRKAIWISSVLYAFGVLIGAYGPLFGVKLPTFVYRNGIFEAPLLLLCGYLMQSARTYVDRGYFLLAAIVGLTTHLVEGVATGRFPVGHEYSFGTLPFAIGLFGLFRTWSIPVGKWGSDVLGAYLVHVFILKILDSNMSATGVVPAVGTAFGVALISLAISRLLKWPAPTRFVVAP